MFLLRGFLRNLFPPLTVFDLHEVLRIHASLRRIRDGPCIYATTRSAQFVGPSVQPDFATFERCLLQWERNALEYGNAFLKKHSFKRVHPVNGYPRHHHRLAPGIHSRQFRSSHRKTTQVVSSIADRTRQNGRALLILAPVWIPSQRMMCTNEDYPISPRLGIRSSDNISVLLLTPGRLVLRSARPDATLIPHRDLMGYLSSLTAPSDRQSSVPAS